MQPGDIITIGNDFETICVGCRETLLFCDGDVVQFIEDTDGLHYHLCGHCVIEATRRGMAVRECVYDGS